MAHEEVVDAGLQLGLTNTIFQVLTFVVAVEDGTSTHEPRVLACRFLLSLYTLDTLGWLVAKLMYFQVLYLSEQEYGTEGIILTSLIMTTVEVIIEFMSSSLTPRLFFLFSGDSELRARQLALFALDAYAANAIAGVIVYGIIGASILIGVLDNRAAIAALIIAYNFQYSFLNQCGDQALELSKPHWLKTFDGIKLRFPSKVCCAALSTTREATADSLSIFLSLSRLIVASVFAVLFVLLRNNAVLRFSFSISMSMLTVAICLVVRSALRGPQGKPVCDSIINEEVEDQDTSTYPYIWNLPSLDITLVAFYVCSFSLPDQAFNAIISLLILRLSTVVAVVVTVIGVIAVVVYFLYQLRKRNPGASSGWLGDMNGGEAVVESDSNSESEFTKWLRLLTINACSLTLAALLFIFTTSTILLYFVLPTLVVYTVAKQALSARFVAFIFKFPESRSSAVGYYANVLYVCVSGPLLAINWLLVETASSAKWQIAVVILVAGGAYVLSTAIFASNSNFRQGIDGISDPAGSIRQHSIMKARLSQL
jgi:hypothetical protein